jgi:hypothetical protein
MVDVCKILGYNDGPPESAEFGVVDGEEIEIKVEHNLSLEGYRNSSLKIKFYKHLPFVVQNHNFCVCTLNNLPLEHIILVSLVLAQTVVPGVHCMSDTHGIFHLHPDHLY